MKRGMSKGKFIFITGGARSGKSSFAQGLAEKYGKRIVFLATADAGDREMKKRIARHKAERPAHWTTVEEPVDLVAAVQTLPPDTDAVLIDCLTLWISNLMMAGRDEEGILSECERLAAALARAPFTAVLVSNEVGAGIVPENKLARAFRDTAGRANQIMARASEQAFALISGCPVKLK